MSATVAPNHYEAHRDYVLGVLRRRCGWLDSSEQEEILHDAYTVVLEKVRDGVLDLELMNHHQVRAYLTQTALNTALRAGKRVWRKRSVALEDGGLEVANGGPAAEDLIAQDYDGARLREIVAELPERQQVIVKLRFFFDRTPDEVQNYLGVTERVYRRELERAMRTVAQRFELVREGTFCESRRSLILAYVSGIAGPNRTRDAQRHLASCQGCAQWAIEMREAARQVGAIVPLPLIAPLATHEHWWTGIGRGLGGLRDRLVDLLGGARDHVTSLAIRADPSSASMLSGVRPGAVAAVIAGCVTVGSGTYCAVSGVPGPLRDLLGARNPSHHQAARAKPKAKAANVASRQSTSPTTHTTTTSRTASSSTKTSSTRTTSTKRQSTTTTSARDRAVASQFGIEGSGTDTTGTSSSSSPSSSSSTTSSGSSKRSSGNWGSEFGP